MTTAFNRMGMNEEQFKLERARDHVKQLKGFYLHLFIYAVVMVVVIIAALNQYRICFICFKNETVWYNLLGYIPWTLALIIHGLFAYRVFKFFNAWEQRKLREYMDE